MHSVTLETGYTISDERRRIDMEWVHRALAGAYWAQGRARALTERSFAHCLAFGVYAPEGHQVGVARVLTDFTFRAHLADVFIEPALRGRGIGKALVATILAHPALATVRTWTLQTRDAHGLYMQFGFMVAPVDDHVMQLDRRPG